MFGLFIIISNIVDMTGVIEWHVLMQVTFGIGQMAMC